MHNQSVLKPKPIYFENDFIYLQFTIEVYGKNWIWICTTHKLTWFETPKYKLN